MRNSASFTFGLRHLRYLPTALASSLCLCLIAPTASADIEGVNIAKAEGENLAEAIGHYSRSRALLLSALREFDKGLKLANPQILIDVKEFRNTILDRAEDLEKVIAPQPKATRKGVQFTPDSRLMSDNFRPK